jgi:hypothetical protein
MFRSPVQIQVDLALAFDAPGSTVPSDKRVVVSWSFFFISPYVPGGDKNTAPPKLILRDTKSV